MRVTRGLGVITNCFRIMNKIHTLSENQIEKYVKEFELSKEQIIQIHKEFLGISRQYICLDGKNLGTL